MPRSGERRDFCLSLSCLGNELLPTIRKTGQYCPALDQLQTLTPAQQRQIRVEVALRAQKCAANYQTIYRALKARFQVARYDQIPPSQFQTALEFIRTVDLTVPEVQNFDDFQESLGEYSKAQAQHLSPQEIQALANVCHLLRLGKPTFQQVYKVLSAAYSPMAPRFYSLMTEPFLCLWELEEVVKRNQNLLLN